MCTNIRLVRSPKATHYERMQGCRETMFVLRCAVMRDLGREELTAPMRFLVRWRVSGFGL